MGKREVKRRIFALGFLFTLLYSPTLYADAAVMPMVRYTWGGALENNWGVGMSIGTIAQSMYKGFYGLYSWSTSGMGRSLSAGYHKSAAGMGGYTLGVTRMVIRKGPRRGRYVGVEVTPVLMVFALRGALMVREPDDESEFIRSTMANLEWGFGVF